MTRKTRIALTTAAALVAVTVALPARADHDDGWRRPFSTSAHAVPVYVPVPAPVPAPVVSVPYRPAHWNGAWRARELRHEYAELAMARDRFYATWDGRPWTRVRFESWYASRRAALDTERTEVGRWYR